jgi:nitrate reductase gamma subunit
MGGMKPEWEKRADAWAWSISMTVCCVLFSPGILAILLGNFAEDLIRARWPDSQRASEWGSLVRWSIIFGILFGLMAFLYCGTLYLRGRIQAMPIR